MPRKSKKKKPVVSSAKASKYDAHHKVINSTYGDFAGLRHQLSESKEDVSERAKLLVIFAGCEDSQRSWLLLEDYFDKLSLARKDFTQDDWWGSMSQTRGDTRLEELALVFMKSGRSVPNELMPHANFTRFAQVEQEEKDYQLFKGLEEWMFPPSPSHLDAPRAALRVVGRLIEDTELSGLHKFGIEIHVIRPRTGDRVKTLDDMADLTMRAAHEQELFPVDDWSFIRWSSGVRHDYDTEAELIPLDGAELLKWLVQWGKSGRIDLEGEKKPIEFLGRIIEMEPHLEKAKSNLYFTHEVILPGRKTCTMSDVRFFAGEPALALIGSEVFLLRNSPSQDVLGNWAKMRKAPVSKLTHRLLTKLRKISTTNGVNWEQLCKTHKATPRFVFEMANDTVRLKLLAKSESDKSLWQWNGHEWIREKFDRQKSNKPEVLDDDRLELAVGWLQRLDWFTPEPGLWVGDANPLFLESLHAAWPDKPEAEYLGDTEFKRLFLQPKRLKPKLIVRGSGIDWLSVSAEWEEEGMKLTERDLQQLAGASGNFVNLPDAGWVQLDQKAVQDAQEAMADLGVDGLSAVEQKIGIEQAAHLDEDGLAKFVPSAELKQLRGRLDEFEGIESTDMPDGICAEMRPYQLEGFSFLCHLAKLKLGGILADDMGLGKTLQTLVWLKWLKTSRRKNARIKPTLVVCPASVLHNWRRESERFTPSLKVLVLESGQARHNLRKRIPDHDIVVTNYSILRRDLDDLAKFAFRAVVLDEAQFIKNPGAQVTKSVKELKADHKLALTGTPIENRMLDLWSIVDFVQPNYLGNQDHFSQVYDLRGAEKDESAARIGRRKLSAKLRPLLLRRVKKQVAKDLPERIEQRLDCELPEEQRKLYLAELKRSREQVMKAVKQKGVAKSKMHVLAALTRLRQICCHPGLVGSDTESGKMDTLYELVEPLLEEGHKVLVFSQFVRMLQILEKQCEDREMPTYLLTGETKNRQDIVTAFQEDESPAVFLLSLRAAGTGLNLTSASYVVIYDPWWNPAVEAQAIDRTHRIGQTSTVNAYKMISPGTVEEKIWDLQQQKAKTVSDVLGDDGFAKGLTTNDLEYLFSD